MATTSATFGGCTLKEVVMIGFELLRDAGVLIVAPKGALTAEDFRAISGTVDPDISKMGSSPDCLSRHPLFLDGTIGAR